MIYEIVHKTKYTYSGPVSHCHSKIWLQPRNLPYQYCHEVMFEIDPLPGVFYTLNDFYGNIVRYFAIQQSHKELSVKVKSRIEIFPRKDFSITVLKDKPWEEIRQGLSKFHKDLVDVYHFKYESQHVIIHKELFHYAAVSFTTGRGLLESVRNLIKRVFQEFKFVSGHTTIATPIEVIFRSKKGVCQDFAHLCIGLIRSHGLAARYVSGYIETLAPVGKEKLVGTDASHAWISVYLPEHGWVDFDPTNNVVPYDRHITLAWGRDFADVSPMKGVVFSTGKQALLVEVDVRRVSV